MGLTIKNCGDVRTEDNVIGHPLNGTRIILEFEPGSIPVGVKIDEILSFLPDWCKSASVTIEGFDERIEFRSVNIDG